MKNSILGVLILLGAGGALTTLIVGIVMTAQRKWRGGLVCLILFVVSLGLFGGMTAWWFANVIHTVKSTIASRQAVMAAAEVKKSAARAQVKSLTPQAGAIQVDDEFWEFNRLEDRDRLPLRYPFELQSPHSRETGDLYRNIAGGKSRDPATQCTAVGIEDITQGTTNAEIFVYHRDDDRGKEAWGVFVFETGEKVEFRTQEAMWAEARKRGWTEPQNVANMQECYSVYWFGI